MQVETTTPLSPRDVAGIAAEPWRQLRNAAVTGQSTQDLEKKVVQTVAITLNALLDPAKQGDAEAKAAARAEISDVWLTSVLQQLSIEPSEALMQQIRRDLSRCHLVHILRWTGFSGQVPSLTSEVGYRP